MKLFIEDDAGTQLKQETVLISKENLK